MYKRINLLQILLVFFIGIVCDAVIFGFISESLSFLFHVESQHCCLLKICLIICCFLLKILLFPIIFLAVESSNKKTKISELIKGLHNNKNILLFVFIIFAILSLFMLGFGKDLYFSNIVLGYLFTIPVHYLALYFYWLYKDVKMQDEGLLIGNYSKKDIYLNFLGYALITNTIFIVVSLMLLEPSLTHYAPNFENMFHFIANLLLELYFLFYLYILIRLLIISIRFVIKFVRQKQ